MMVYFQPPGIKEIYCEAGMIIESNEEYIYYLNEPCKILRSEVKIIPKENVIFDRKSSLYIIKKQQDEKQVSRETPIL